MDHVAPLGLLTSTEPTVLFQPPAMAVFPLGQAAEALLVLPVRPPLTDMMLPVTT